VAHGPKPRSYAMRVNKKMKRTRLSSGKRPDQKRAVVTLAEGDTIEIFEAKGP